MVEELLRELDALPQVEAIALGGSRAQATFDEKSDYDLYIYVREPIDEEIRENILSKYCLVYEIKNQYWEEEDNATLKTGIDIDIIYRDLDSFEKGIEEVVEKYQAHNGYTTCMWHNLKTCKILYDPKDYLWEMKMRFDVPYPKELQENIIKRNWNLLHQAFPAYDRQIEKANERNDIISLNHRTTAFIESYFDILFAINEMTHPGEKRLVQLCKENCSILPNYFEENLQKLLTDLYFHPEKTSKNVERILVELKKIFPKDLTL